MNPLRISLYKVLPQCIGISLASFFHFVSGDTIKVFILAGQSNMAGWAPTTGLPLNLTQIQNDAIIWDDGNVNASKVKQWLNLGTDFGGDTCYFGPELNFGRTMADSLSGVGVKVALIKYSAGGTDLYNEWRPPGSGGITGNRYKNLLNIIKMALDSLPGQYTPEIAGIVWMQGESDGTNAYWATAYQTNLTNLIADLRNDEKKPELPFVAGMVHLSPDWIFADVVRHAETIVAYKDSTVGIFETQDLPLGGDSAHYQTAAMVEVGKRSAQTMLQLMKKTNYRPLVVDAGLRQYPISIHYPVVCNLNGKIIDVGKPFNISNIKWEEVSGPGTVTFGDNTNPVTTVVFPQEGTYHLRLSAKKETISSMGAVTIFVASIPNVALVASSCSTSYCSPGEFLDAINDGADPVGSNDYTWAAYSNWPLTGTQWVQYNWPLQIKANKIDVYWYTDNGIFNAHGINVPENCELKYWNGTAFLPVTGGSGYGIAPDRYNTTTFDEVTTNSLRLEFTSKTDSSTGILEWKVFDSVPVAVRHGPVKQSNDFSLSFGANKLHLYLPCSACGKRVRLRFFDESGRMIKQFVQDNLRERSYSFGLGCLEASRMYLAEVKFNGKSKTVAFCTMQ
jgi:hypothetical protein